MLRHAPKPTSSFKSETSRFGAQTVPGEHTGIVRVMVGDTTYSLPHGQVLRQLGCRRVAQSRMLLIILSPCALE